MGDAVLGETTGEAEGKRLGIMGASPGPYHRLKRIGHPVCFSLHKLGIYFISTLNHANSWNIQHAKQDGIIAVIQPYLPTLDTLSPLPLATSHLPFQKARFKSLPLHVLPGRVPGLHRCVAVVCRGGITAVSERRNPLLGQLRIGIAVILCRHSLASNLFVMIHRGGPGDIPIVLKGGASATVVATDGTALPRQLVVAEILAGVAGLVAHVVQQFVEARCEEGT